MNKNCKGKILLCLLLVGVVMFGACSKDNATVEETPDTKDTVYYIKHRVENLYAPIDDKNPTATPTVFFFNLTSHKHVDASFAKTTDWDVAFGSLYNSFLSGNNGQNVNNYGAGATGQGGICILKQPFDSVIAIPEASAFKTAKDLVGTDDAGAFGVGTGWYLYDFSGLVIGDGSYNKQHVAYALANPLKLPNGTWSLPRTVVVRTAKGDYAKLKMISCYKDAFTPDTWFRETPHMYFTFEYVIVPKGSTKFEIK